MSAPPRPCMLAVLWITVTASAALALPRYDHVVVVIEENHSYANIVGSSAAPFINGTLIAEGASLTKMYGEEHHSQGNYHWLFSGSNQNIGFNDPGIVGPFTDANLGSELIANGLSFKGYSEGLPSIGSTVSSSGAYARKHNPWVAFSNVPNGTTVAASSNLRFTDFPTDFTQLPTVSIVAPDQNHDMHNGSDPGTITTGDTWLQSNIGGYYQWAKTHNSLLIVTWDEDKGSTLGLTDPASASNKNQIATLFAGPGVIHDTYAEGAGVTHVNLLRTLEDMYGLGHAGAQQSKAVAAGIGSAAISDVFALPGDATGDGIVNFDDLVILAQNYNQSGNTSYQIGDFTNDGLVNFDDLVILAQHYNSAAIVPGAPAAFTADWALAQSLVPEPTTLGVVALAPLALARRR